MDTLVYKPLALYHTKSHTSTFISTPFIPVDLTLTGLFCPNIISTILILIIIIIIIVIIMSNGDKLLHDKGNKYVLPINKRHIFR